VTAARHATLLTGFPRLAQVAHLSRTVRGREGTPVEVTSFITSCRPHRTPAAQLLALMWGHWSSEARHWVRDVTFGEDRSRLRCGHAPQVMATLRSLAITLIRRTKTTAIAAQRRFFAYHPAQALALLLSKTHSAR
jgi:hypothetical protein